MRDDTARRYTRRVRVECFALSEVGPLRDSNEDGFAFDERCGLYAVFDGMGGGRSGSIAVEVATREFRLFVAGLDGIAATHQELESRARALLQRINRAIRASYNGGSSGWITTGALLALSDSDALVAHVGDSRAYLLRHGRLDRLTEDHTLVEEFRKQAPLSSGPSLREIEERYGNVLMRCLGAAEELAIDTRVDELHPSDGWLLCTDGLWRAVGEGAMESTISAEQSPVDLCRSLMALAIDAKPDDNVTLMVVRRCR